MGAVEQAGARILQKHCARAGQQEGDPPVPEGHIDHSRPASKGHGGGIEDQPAARHAAFHQRVAERGRGLPPPAHRARGTTFAQQHPVGAIDLSCRGGGVLCQRAQAARQVMRQPEVVLIRKGHRAGGQIGMAEQAEVIRTHAGVWPAQQDHRVGPVRRKGADQGQRVVGGAVIADPERPVRMVLRGKAGQLLAQERSAVACAHEHGDMGQGGHAARMARGDEKCNHKLLRNGRSGVVLPAPFGVPTGTA